MGRVTWKHYAIGGASATVSALGAFLWWRKRSADVDVLGGSGGQGNNPGSGVQGQGQGQGQSSGETSPNTESNNVGSAGNPPPLSSSQWGAVPIDLQKTLTEVQAAAGIPYLWVYGSICAQGESAFQANAHNLSKKETKASSDGLANGLKRGNPSPKYADAIRDFGSGGLFGALSPYFHWIGLDEGYMPFLRRKPELVFQPKASAVFMAHYFWRVSAPMYAKGRRLNLFDIRVGWASPSILKNDPFGTTAQEVRGRMRESIQVIGWDEKWVESLPVARDAYKGIQAVAPAMGFSPAQED